MNAHPRPGFVILGGPRARGAHLRLETRTATVNAMRTHRRTSTGVRQVTRVLVRRFRREFGVFGDGGGAVHRARGVLTVVRFNRPQTDVSLTDARRARDVAPRFQTGEESGDIVIDGERRFAGDGCDDAVIDDVARLVYDDPVANLQLLQKLRGGTIDCQRFCRRTVRSRRRRGARGERARARSRGDAERHLRARRHRRRRRRQRHRRIAVHRQHLMRSRGRDVVKLRPRFRPAVKLLRESRVHPRHHRARCRVPPLPSHERRHPAHEPAHVIARVHVSVPSLRVRIVSAPSARRVRDARAAIRVVLAPRDRAPRRRRDRRDRQRARERSRRANHL